MAHCNQNLLLSIVELYFEQYLIDSKVLEYTESQHLKIIYIFHK